jgi:hypothetical protein
MLSKNTARWGRRQSRQAWGIATKLVAFSFLGGLRATQYEIPFKLSINTLHVSVMAITPAMASHKVRHPSW